ncbi:RICIN domain-containing protein [Kitasatospora sp. NBC_00240]|uniref:RICIN domain-containing protein n=1 Tax=Kitasatospora sp. NBC_00240 TaxID=2903567 RepID=UPI0022578714|nr:RICIN domain-containing protein [Kitasatospora sp. NBC_00240]MCX5216010.1 RICIN domain-containing protein [Kitasatospora sp. NBC_00240]
MGTLALGTWGLMVVPPPAAAATPETSVTVDGHGLGRVFDGIGAVSGGGGNSRLLIDYPEPQRSQILDYMFKPGYGAALQILKVEIGGDTNSTDGAEDSHEHIQGQVDCNTGYEWWLMEQAKERNPQIKLAALAWGAPGWVSANGSDMWSDKAIGYLKDWLDCAKNTHHLTVDYFGGRNEVGPPPAAWFENLRSSLNSAGYSGVKLVADDDWSGFPNPGDTTGTWPLLGKLQADPAYAAAVDIIGHHYPCEGVNGGTNGTGTAYNCPVPEAAKQLGKPIWASENGSQDLNTGAAPQIRTITRGYVDGRITATFNWPLIGALYPNMPFHTDGLLQANQPWSGNYSVGTSVWSTAQVTQVTQPGWQFIDSASGYLAGSSGTATSPGSYISLKSPNGTDWSTVVETTTAGEAQTVHLRPTGGLTAGPLHVWATNLNSKDPGQYFQQQTDLAPADGGYTFTAQPGWVYSLTTLTSPGRGTATAPPRAAMSLPYGDDFESAPAVGHMPALLADMNGAFEVQPCDGGRAGSCVRQMAPVKPLPWGNVSDPYTLMGDGSWRDYTVGVDALLQQPGAVRLMARAGTQSGPAWINSYYLQVSDTGAWSIVRTDYQGAQKTTLVSGTTTALGTGTWHHLDVTVQGTAITAAVDHTVLGSATDTSHPTGQVGVGLDSYRTQEFDNLTVTPIGTQPTPYTYAVTSALTGQALDLAGDPNAEGAKTVQQPVSGAASQLWRLTASRGVFTLANGGSGKVLDVPGNSLADSVQLQQSAPGAGTGQQWGITPAPGGAYTVTSKLSGKAMDVDHALTTPGTKIIQYHSTGRPNQRWNLRMVPVDGVGYPIANAATGQNMDMSGGSKSAGGLAVQWPANGAPNQVWDLHTAATPGNFTITNRNSGLCLDVAGAVTTDQAKVQQWTCTGGRSQQWSFQQTPDGTWTLTNLNSGKVLDTAGASTTKGAQLVQAAPSGTAATQQWTFLAP